MAGSKSTQTRFVRDNCIYYTSLRLLFFIITHLLMSIYLSIEVCGRHSGYSQLSRQWDDRFDSITCIITGYFCIPQLESKRRDVQQMRLSLTNLVCVLFDPAIPTSSFNFIQLFLYLYYLIITKIDLILYYSIITLRACARGKLIGRIVVVVVVIVSTNIDISRCLAIGT